mmetsp:Transcript_14588/g.17749  ORF Transcript_14588/g.17749 Transcript_14588/m.17749 type:complete len:384 (-) Transcript_14588:162-1313(-)
MTSINHPKFLCSRLLLLQLLTFLVRTTDSFAPIRAPPQNHHQFSSRVGRFSSFFAKPSSISQDESSFATSPKAPSKYNDPAISIHKYKHKQWDLTYLYKPPSPGSENKSPIVLIHPVGVGISSWFWTKVMKEYGESIKGGNPPIYAVDLIGCGLEHGASEWIPEEAGLFFPSGWVEGVETLIQDIVLPRYHQVAKDINNGCTVVVQGGLTSVGVLLSSRNTLSVVSKLVLTSPTTWDEMINPIPEDELERNYNFLRSKIFGNLAFSILESRKAVQLFSNLFLFTEECDEEWLNYTMHCASFKARTPVQAFNAGLCGHRSFEDEMITLKQKVVIISGKDDKRSVNRELYKKIRDCELKTLSGLNVLPWENPTDIVATLREVTEE